MPDRTRPIRKEICLNEQELSVVRHKMNQLGRLHRAEKVSCRCQQDCHKHQPRLPPH